MRGFGLGIFALALLSTTSSCIVAQGDDDEGTPLETISASLGTSPSVEEASTSQPGTELPGEVVGRTAVSESYRALEVADPVTGPTPDPWFEFRPGDCNSGPTPDPWNPGQPKESDGRPGSEQGSSPSGTKPK